MSKQDEKKQYEQQEEKILAQSDAFVRLLTKRGILADQKVDSEKVRSAKQEKTKNSYHNTLMLLQQYHTIIWMMECFPETIAEELERPFEGVETLIPGHLIKRRFRKPVFYPFDRGSGFRNEIVYNKNLIVEYSTEAYRKIYKDTYPEGTRIVLIEMKNDPNPVPKQTKGTVDSVDDAPTIQCRFDNEDILTSFRAWMHSVKFHRIFDYHSF